jgi:O-antigen ligase
MHYLAIAFVLLSYPGLVYLLKTYPRWRHWAYFFIGILPFVVHVWQLEAALVNWAAWPGYAKGIVMTVEVTLALAIITTQRRPGGVPPLVGWLVLYMLAVAFSITQAGVWMAASFYLFQLLCFAVIMIAVAKIAADPRALQWLGTGLACGMIYEAVVTIDQRLHGAFQAPGTMAHPNQLGMMVHVAILPIIGMLLAGHRSRVLMLGVASAFVVIVLGASRATIGFVALGVALVLLMSLVRHSTPHKKRMIGFAAAALVVATPFLLRAVSERLAQQQERDNGGYDERAAFERAAKAMWNDHPLGVGANNYVVVANGQGYSARAGVTWVGGSRATNVHNTYLLIGAETGWAGLVTYIAMIGAAILAGLRFAFGQRRDPRGDIALGSAIGIAMVGLHSQYEWISVTYQVQYVIAISFGVISGLVRLRALERKRASRDRAAALGSMQLPAGEAIA